MRIERYGNGPKAFLGLHGWNGDHRTFLPLVSDLPADVTFLSVDLPGCGASPQPARWDLETITAEVLAPLHGPVTLVGNCSGAIFALAAARSAPGLVNRIVLIDAFAVWPWYFRIFLSPAIGWPAYLSVFGNPAGRWLTNASLSGKRKPDTDLTRGFAGTDHQATYRYLTMLGGAGRADAFAGLQMPIDVLYGARSFAQVRNSARIWADIWPQARVFQLQGAGHLPILEATSQVRQILFGGDLCSTTLTTSFASSTI